MSEDRKTFRELVAAAESQLPPAGLLASSSGTKHGDAMRQRLLQALGDETLTTAELAERVRMGRTSVLFYMRTLAERGVVERLPGRYSTSYRLVRRR